MQREKVNKIFNIRRNCMAGCTNSHIINLLHSGKFTNVNFTQSKLAKSLHLKIGAKVIKKLNTNKLNLQNYEKISNLS